MEIAFWIAVYWMVIFLIFLEWYRKNGDPGKHEKMNLFFCFLFIGFTPVILLLMVFMKVKDDKR